MKTAHSWHYTPLGTLACWLGSIQLAVPVMTLVALALCWGTYLESTQDAKVARAAVYGSWWFMALMGLVCVSLIFAAITRYPWKRKHVGFLVVHASLVALIVGGFWSLMGQVEGRLVLQQGETAASIEMTQERIELLEHQSGKFTTLGELSAPTRPGRVVIGGFPVDVVAVWDNVREEFEVVDDGPEPYRAVQIAFGPMKESAMWIGQEDRGEAPVIDGLRIRVLSAGADWQPPAQNAAQPAGPGQYAFKLGDKQYPLAAEGQDAFPGWKIVSIKRYSQASVSAGKIEEGGDQKDNPAVEVIISDGKGSIEKHTAFEQFPDMVMSKNVEGASRSGARLAPSAAKAGAPVNEETLVIYGALPGIKIGYFGRDGAARQLEHDGTFPWFVDLGSRKFTVLGQLARAQERSNFVQAPSAKEHRPALVLKTGGKEVIVAWKTMQPLDFGDGRVGLFRFGPRTWQLPFSVRLDQFRKMDYPGTDMAMAYESDVSISAEGQPNQQATISMNNPLQRDGWKVYQSGFMGDTVSIFSVMRDPGLPLTYLASTTLCIGILITFYGRGLSWGHPGIPAPSFGKEKSHASAASGVGTLASASLIASRGQNGAVDGEAGLNPDSGRRPSDAAGYVRA